MQTDELFHEYFQLVPEVIFELLQIKPACTYRFESPVVKTSERRMDGFLEPEKAECPYYFVEIQGYYDKRIYWRLLHHVSRYHESRKDLDGKNWKAIVLYVDKGFDPGVKTLGPLENGSKHWLIRDTFPNLLNKLEKFPAPLNVLQPLIVTDKKVAMENGASWVQSIRDYTQIDAKKRADLTDLLVELLQNKAEMF